MTVRNRSRIPVQELREQMSAAVIAYGDACARGRTDARRLHLWRFLDLLYPHARQRVVVVPIESLAPTSDSGSVA